MLKRKNRLTTNSSFKATFCQNRVVSDEFFVVYAGKNKQNKEQEVKIGVITAKKVHKRAVIRNKIKRRLREAFRIYMKENEIPFISLVAIAKENSIYSDFNQTLKSVYKLTAKLAKKYFQEY